MNASIDVLQYLNSQELYESMETLITDIQEFATFLQNDPWNQPVTIYGTVTNIDESVTITVKSDSVVTSGNYNLTYITSDAALSWFVHRCKITAEYKDKSFTKNRFAFSMGKIEFNIDEEDFKAKSKEYRFFFETTDIFPDIHLLISKLFTNIVAR